MNQDLSMYRPAAFSIIYGLENTPLPLIVSLYLQHGKGVLSFHSVVVLVQ